MWKLSPSGFVRRYPCWSFCSVLLALFLVFFSVHTTIVLNESRQTMRLYEQLSRASFLMLRASWSVQNKQPRIAPELKHSYNRIPATFLTCVPIPPPGRTLLPDQMEKSYVSNSAPMSLHLHGALTSLMPVSTHSLKGWVFQKSVIE